MNNKNNNVVRATLRTATQVIAILAVILVTLIACGKKDNKESVSNKDLIGTWVLESSTIDGKNLEDIIVGGQKILNSSCPKQRFVFTDKEAVIYDYHRSYEKPNQCEEERVSGSYVVSGNTLVIKRNDMAASFTISINGNKLSVTSIFNSRGDEELKQFDGKKTVSIFRKL